MSFAIIETGGKQYKVSASKILEIEKLNAKVGETIKFNNVLLLNDDKNIESWKKEACKRGKKSYKKGNKEIGN